MDNSQLNSTCKGHSTILGWVAGPDLLYLGVSLPAEDPDWGEEGEPAEVAGDADQVTDQNPHRPAQVQGDAGGGAGEALPEHLEADLTRTRHPHCSLPTLT